MFDGNDNPLAKGIQFIKYLAIFGGICAIGLVGGLLYLLVTWLA
jgi:hypothetical protein